MIKKLLSLLLTFNISFSSPSLHDEEKANTTHSMALQKISVNKSALMIGGLLLNVTEASKNLVSVQCYDEGEIKYLNCDCPDLPEAPSTFWEDTGSLFIAGTASVIAAAFVIDGVAKKGELIVKPFYSYIIKPTFNCFIAMPWNRYILRREPIPTLLSMIENNLGDLVKLTNSIKSDIKTIEETLNKNPNRDKGMPLTGIGFSYTASFGKIDIFTEDKELQQFRHFDNEQNFNLLVNRVRTFHEPLIDYDLDSMNVILRNIQIDNVTFFNQDLLNIGYKNVDENILKFVFFKEEFYGSCVSKVIVCEISRHLDPI